MPASLRDRIADVLVEADTDAFVHAVDIDRGHATGLGEEAPVVTASTFKIFVLLEAARQVAAGALSWTTRIHVPAEGRTMGPTGLSVMLDDAELSLRDLALLMMQISDNHATDVVQGVVGTDAIAKTIAELGLTDTVIDADCRKLLDDFFEEMGGRDTVGTLSPQRQAELLAASPTIQAKVGNRTTARDMTKLLSAIWRDEAGPADACAEVRRIMGLQHAPHRLNTAYGDGVAVAGKTGTLYGGIRNEVGVFEFPDDGGRYALAVFLKQRNHRLRDARADRAIGEIARSAIELLREARG